jgi:mRNA deadenylase 3'-5' endonuclease subunit Ccr4
MSSPSWVTELGLIPSEKGSTPADSFVTVISWNILAEAYTSPRSHPNLPQPYADAIFDTNIRRDLILESLRRLLFLQHDSPSVDVLCLQEVDATLLPTLGPFFQSLGYRFVYAPRAVNESQAKAAPDGCAIVYSSKWNCLASKIVRFDDLADTNRPPLNLQQDDTLVSNYTSTYNPSARAGLMGMTSSYRRRNAALLVHLVSTDSSTSNDSTSVIVGNAHLYWHPGFEYVKLSQAYYLLHHLQQFTQDVRTTHNPAIVLCGDFNSKPESIVYRFITRGTIDATVVAPWKNTTHFYDRDRNSNAPNESVYEDDWKSPSTTTDVDASSSEEDVAMEQSILDPLLCEPYPDTILNESNSSLDEDFDFASLTIHEATSNNNANMSLRIDGNPKYMLDFTLNKLSRWLRILGLDAALETEDEERARTRDGNMYVINVFLCFVSS